MSVETRPGTRLCSAVCGTQVVVVRAAEGEMDLRCGGVPMLPLGVAAAGEAAPRAGYENPTVLGKRYTDPAETIELLCTVAGHTALSLGTVRLAVKAAKPLPASD